LLKININPIHEKEVLEFNIPSLILQPLVENSIIHGFPDDFPVNGQILIDFDYRKDRLICLVKDNGKGFSDGKYNFGGIGLQNVQNRINMYNYGLIKKQTGFLNIFREDGYTTAKIVIYGKF
jgi:two-component system sensor histidine kinase YesM